MNAMANIAEKMLVLCSVLLMASCQMKDGTDCFAPVNAEGWHSKDTVSFNIPTMGHEADYSLRVKVRINRKYEYKDLWVVAEQTYAQEDEPKDGEKPFLTLTDTIHILLIDEKGNLSGEGKNLMTFCHPVRNVRLKNNSNGQIRLHHIMDEKCIRGVHDVGVELLPLEPVTSSINTQHDEQKDGETPQR